MNFWGEVVSINVMLSFFFFGFWYEIWGFKVVDFFKCNNMCLKVVKEFWLSREWCGYLKGGGFLFFDDFFF